MAAQYLWQPMPGHLWRDWRSLHRWVPKLGFAPSVMQAGLAGPHDGFSGALEGLLGHPDHLCTADWQHAMRSADLLRCLAQRHCEGGADYRAMAGSGHCSESFVGRGPP